MFFGFQIPDFRLRVGDESTDSGPSGTKTWNLEPGTYNPGTESSDAA
jgi:hypothetical protein